MPLYCTMRTHYILDDYLSLECDWVKARLITQFRANVAQLAVAGSVVKLNEVRNKYDSSVSAICGMCNMQVNEDFFHVLSQCPKYNDLRCKFLNNFLFLTIMSTYLCFWFQKFFKEDLNCLYYLTQAVIKLRGENMQ